MRGLTDQYKLNEAGEALYDSSRCIMDQVTDSLNSLPSGDRSPGKKIRMYSRKKGKKTRKSHTSIVMEEPSREDKGFYLKSRHSGLLNCSYKSRGPNMLDSSINISIKRDLSVGSSSHRSRQLFT